MPAGELTDEEVPAWWRSLGLPGLVDVHVHFLPEPVQRKVWRFFDEAERHYGSAWPVRYRLPEAERVDRLRALGVRAFPSLPYPHKPGMAAWLNAWSADFAARVPECLSSATLFPEPGVDDYLATALDGGARVVKVHVQVGGFDPADARLDAAWGLLAETGTPVVVHCGSRPLPGPHTGPGPMQRVLARHPRLTLVIAHLGMNEYAEHLSLAERHPRVYLDTTMFATDYTERFAPFPPALLPRLAALGDRILLGSDFPSIPYPYAHQLESLERLGLGAEWLCAVLWGNGARLFGVPAA